MVKLHYIKAMSINSGNDLDFTILVDLDGVCADIHTFWYEQYNQEYDDNLTVEEIMDWKTHLFVKDECGKEIYKYITLPGFFYTAPVIEGCVESLKELHDFGINIIICTAAPQASQTGHYEKVMWVKKHLPFIGTYDLVSTHRKDLIRGDLLIDDGPHNLEDFPGITCAFTRPWNTKCKSDYRVSAWKDFTKLAISLAKLKNGSNIEGESNV